MVTSCPSRKQLARFLAGEVTEDSLESMAAHIETCSDCQLVADELDHADGLIDDLRYAEEANLREEAAALERLVAAAEDLGSSQLVVRCIECHTPIDVSAPDSFEEVECPKCRNRFSLLADRSLPDGDLQRVGQFEFLEQTGVGSYGVVWKARDTQLDRTVAVKIPRRGQLDEVEAEVFLREARAAAQLHHRHIVSVREVGRQDGLIYIVSDFVDGLDLADWLGGQQLSMREAAELAAKLAEALEHAHQAGVIHRDLKPSNIMIDTEGEPHVTDFGLARRQADEVTMTHDGRVLGTPAYMSPEQAQGETHHAGPTSDIFSLGVSLYELLTGERPFRGSTQMLLRQIVEGDPPSPRKFNSHIPRDLETVCLKCLEKEPGKRYPTAQALAEDLRRFLGGEPVRARRITALGRTWRWCRRKPVVATLTAALALAIVGGFAGIADQWVRADKEAVRNRLLLYASDMGMAQRAWDEGRALLTRELLERHVPTGRRDDLRGFEWRFLNTQLMQSLSYRILPCDQPVAAVRYSPDGQVLATLAGNSSVRLWNAHTLQLLRTIDLGETNDVVGPTLAFSADSRTFAVSPDLQSVQLWDVATGEMWRQLAKQSETIRWLAISPDGQFLAAGTSNGRIPIWDLASGELARTIDAHDYGVPSASFSPDGKLATGGWDGRIQVYDLSGADPPIVVEDLRHRVIDVAFSPDGTTLASGRVPDQLCLWNTETWEKITELPLANNHCGSLRFSRDSQMLAAGGPGTIGIWDVQSRQRIEVLRGHEGGITFLDFSADGTALASASADKTVRIWRIGQHSGPSEYLGVRSWFVGLAHSPVAPLFAVSADENAINLWNWSTGIKQVLEGHDRRIYSVAFSHDGKILVSGSGDGTARVWDVATGKVVHTLRHVDKIWSVACSPSGDLLAAGAGEHGPGRKAWVWRLPRYERQDLYSHTGYVLCSAFSPDGTTLALGGGKWPPGARSEVTFWDVTVDPPHLIERWTGEIGIVYSLAFSPDGRLFALGGREGVVKVRDMSSGSWRYTLRAHGTLLSAVAFSPDNKTLATASADGTVRLWQAATGSAMITLKAEPPMAVANVVFSPDGTALIAAHYDGTVKIWRAGPLDHSQY